jgi:hypothetical protein
MAVDVNHVLQARYPKRFAPTTGKKVPIPFTQSSRVSSGLIANRLGEAASLARVSPNKIVIAMGCLAVRSAFVAA